MQAVFVVLIAVLGILGGAGITGVLQQKNAARMAEDAKSERRRQDRLTAYLEFGQAIAQLRNAEITRWASKAESGRGSSEYAVAKAEEYRSRSAARGALIRIQLLIDGEDLVHAAQQVLDVEQAGSEKPRGSRCQIPRCHRRLHQDRSAERRPRRLTTAKRHQACR